MSEVVLKDAHLSEDGLYRYRLLRRWDSGTPLPFIMLNPSTADAEMDDPTIRRCMGFARDLGFPGIGVWNLYAFRTTDPKDLWKADNPVGPDNNRRLTNLIRWAGLANVPVIAAWGAHAKPDRVAWLCSQEGASCLHALKVTKTGAPGHPLYLPKTARPIPWSFNG